VTVGGLLVEATTAAVVSEAIEKTEDTLIQFAGALQG
jgi:hypothetical protein